MLTHLGRGSKVNSTRSHFVALVFSQGSQFLSYLQKLGLLMLLVLMLPHSLFALTFPLPQKPDNIVGQISFVTIEEGDNLYAIARAQDVGIKALLAANPNVNPNQLKIGQKIIIPTAFVIPTAPRNGIIINLAELRLYYFPPDQNTVMTFPIGIGTEGWETPTVETYVLSKTQNPFWYPPDSIRAEAEGKGKQLPKAVPPGPDNPLGDYAIYLGLEGYLIHGTLQPNSIGQRSSHGCIRMYPEDIEQLYGAIYSGTPVYIIHEPYKVGLYHNEYYLEGHAPLNGYDNDFPLDIQFQALNQTGAYQIDWDRTQQIVVKNLGYPVLIGRGS